MNKFISAIAAAGMLIATSSLVSAQDKLTGAQLKAAIPGSFTITVFGFDIGVTADAGGALSVSFLGNTDTGRWSIRSDQLCINLPQWTKGEVGCTGIRYDGSEWFTTDDGTRFSAH